MAAIRRAGIGDTEQIVALRMAFLREEQPDAVENEAEIAELTRRYVADKLPKGEFVVWLAEEDGRVVGTGGLVFFHRPPTFHCKSELHAYVLNMYTTPEERRRGIATAVLQQIVEYVRTTPAARISLNTTDEGRSVYERFGFSASEDAMSLTL